MLLDAPDASDLWSSQPDTAVPAASNLPVPFPGGEAALRIPSTGRGAGSLARPAVFRVWMLRDVLGAHCSTALGHFLLIFILSTSLKTQLNNCAAHHERMEVSFYPPLFTTFLIVKKLLDIKIHLYFSSDSLKQRVIVESCWKQRLMLPHWHLSWQTLSALKINHR